MLITKMKYINKYIMAPAAALGLLAFVSCDDFLDLKPLNDIVAENYWTERADVISVLNSCYSQMESNDVLRRMFVWGEVRSDNVTFGASTPIDLQRVFDENITQENTWADWTSFYQVINRCNTVIHFAPEVAQIDPNYTDSEMRANIAEATFLRTLSYFYLIRTFGAVPYSDQPSIDDSDIDGQYRKSAVEFDAMIQQLISDLEAVKGDALKLYPYQSGTGYASNTSYVTTCAIYALLADLYLWAQDYQKCIDYCDLVFAYKMDRYEDLKEEEPEELNTLEVWLEKYPLLKEQPSGNTLGATYNEIFGTGNSFESIFELFFRNHYSVQNTMVQNFFGSTNNSIGQCLAAPDLVTNLTDNQNNIFRSSDCRIYESFFETQSQYTIRKYASQSVSLTADKTGANASYSARHSMRSDAYANWIIYRLTDVMLMKAEAEIELGTESAFNDAFNLISVVYNRGNNFVAASADSLSRADYTTLSARRDLLLTERRREFLFEGKRYYDLLRYTRRVGTSNYMVGAVVKKQKERQAAIRTQLYKEGALYWPYLKRELDANPNLKQNPAYIENETSQK